MFTNCIIKSLLTALAFTTVAIATPETTTQTYWPGPTVSIDHDIYVTFPPPSALNTIDGSRQENIWSPQFRTTVVKNETVICQLNTTDTEGCKVKIDEDYLLVELVYGNNGDLVVRQLAFKPELDVIVFIEATTYEEAAKNCNQVLGSNTIVNCYEAYEYMGAGYGFAVPYFMNLAGADSEVVVDPYSERKTDDEFMPPGDSPSSANLFSSSSVSGKLLWCAAAGAAIWQ